MKKLFKIFRKSQKVNSWLFLDYLWSTFILDCINDVKLPEGLTITQYGKNNLNKFRPNSTNSSEARSLDFAIDCGIEKFRFEVNVCDYRPKRKMEWAMGEHASLYDQYICKEHKLILTTHDDERYISGGTVFCPLCNKDIIKDRFKGNEFPYEYYICETDEEWKSYLKYAKFYRNLIRKENLRWKFREFSRKVKYLFKKLFDIHNWILTDKNSLS